MAHRGHPDRELSFDPANAPNRKRSVATVSAASLADQYWSEFDCDPQDWKYGGPDPSATFRVGAFEHDKLVALAGFCELPEKAGDPVVIIHPGFAGAASLGRWRAPSSSKHC